MDNFSTRLRRAARSNRRRIACVSARCRPGYQNAAVADRPDNAPRSKPTTGVPQDNASAATSPKVRPTTALRSLPARAPLRCEACPPSDGRGIQSPSTEVRLSPRIGRVFDRAEDAQFDPRPARCLDRLGQSLVGHDAPHPCEVILRFALGPQRSVSMPLGTTSSSGQPRSAHSDRWSCEVTVKPMCGSLQVATLHRTWSRTGGHAATSRRVSRRVRTTR